jgi:hypothetical protein
LNEEYEKTLKMSLSRKEVMIVRRLTTTVRTDRFLAQESGTTGFGTNRGLFGVPFGIALSAA